VAIGGSAQAETSRVLNSVALREAGNRAPKRHGLEQFRENGTESPHQTPAPIEAQTSAKIFFD